VIMANSSGVSGPFNPSIGLGLAQDGVASPQAVIGVSAANLASIASTSPWGRSASGNFIGISSTRTVSYKQSYGGSTPPQVDFDPTFKPAISDETLPGLGSATYTQITAPDQYKFVTGAKAASVVTTIQASVQSGATHTAGATATVTVLDQYDAPMTGQIVNFSVIGGSAPGGACAPVSGTTIAAGTTTTLVTATAAGTVACQAAVGAVTDPFTAVLT
jgi:hypothetical protein